MKTSTTTFFVAALLPLLSVAQNPANDAAASSVEKAAAEKAAAEKAALQKAEAQSAATEKTAPARVTTTTETVSKPAEGEEVGIGGHDGITRSGADLMMTRNGVTSKLSQVVDLPNGMKVKPDGTFITRDGASATLRAGQRITLQGLLVESPIRESVVPNPVPQAVIPHAATVPAQPTGRGAGNQATVSGNMPNPAPKLSTDGGAK